MERVLQVIGSLNNGGSQAMIMNIYRNIDRTKVQFDFVIFHNEERFFAKEIENLGGKIYYIEEFKFGNLISFYKKWRNFLKEHEEHRIVHGHVRSVAAIYLYAAKKENRVAIAHSHNTSSGKGYKAIIKNLLQVPIRYVADELMACSKQSGVWLYGRNKKFTVINNPVDCDKFSFNEENRTKLREELCLKGKKVLVHVGRFNVQKNHSFLIDIFNEYARINDDAILLLVGSGELENEIRIKVDKLGLADKVIFMGVRADVENILSASDLMLFPSLHEGLPVSLVEAQANGLPILASDTVTKEVNITGLIEYEALESDLKHWSTHIQNMCNVDWKRGQYSAIVKQHDYGAVECAENISKQYKQYLNKHLGLYEDIFR